MSRGVSSLPDEFVKLLALVQNGKLFAVRDWIASGKPLHFSEIRGSKRSLLEHAIQTGFHSMVELLLRSGGFSAEELALGLEFARDRSRFEIAELLVQFGAKAKEIDFKTACEKLDFPVAERLLRAGFDPNKENDFAQVLSALKAKPLVGFYKNHRAEFPVLDDQAAIALRIAVQNNDVRWAALLRWAGADPFRRAPDNLDEHFPVQPESEDWSTAADDAIWRGDGQLLKALHLNPTPDQAVDLLKPASYKHNVTQFKTLLASVPREKLNRLDRNSCEALEQLVGSWPDENFLTRTPNEQGNAEKLQCIELLLDAGARWNPPVEDLKSDRRYLMRHDPKYIVQVIRLILYTPNAAETPLILELCRSQSLLAKIAVADAALVSEIKELSKQQRLSNGNTHTPSTTAAQVSVHDG